VVQESEQLHQLFREVVGQRCVTALAAQRERLERTAARRTADAQIHPIGIQRVQHAELFGDLERAVVRQHDAAGSEPDALRLRTQPREQNFRCRARQRLGRVVLGNPVAPIAEPIGKPRELEAVVQGLPRSRPDRDGGLIDD